MKHLMLNETSPRKKRKTEPQNDYVSDDDRVSVMAIVSQPSKCLKFMTVREGCFVICN